MNNFLIFLKHEFSVSPQLRKAIIDHVSDSFLDTTVPLLVLIEAAKNGREREIKEYAAIFREHTNRLVEVSMLKFYSKSRKMKLSFPIYNWIVLK